LRHLSCNNLAFRPLSFERNQRHNSTQGVIVDSPGSSLPQPPNSPDQTANAFVAPPRRNVIFFNDRGLRAGWRLAIYLSPFVAIWLATRRHEGEAPEILPPIVMLIGEGISFIGVFGMALIMSRIERRSPGQYGLPVSGAFGRNFWLGMLFGLLEVTLLIALIAAFGGYSFGSLALAPAGILRWGLLHLILFTLVGLFEEFAFRGYTQFTLADGIGFWPAAILLSVGFGAIHLTNKGEGPVGAASVATVGLLFVFSLYRTGNLWYAVGLHASFDWGETFLYSVPNSGAVMQGHLSYALLHGPTWLTGGSVGPEGSVFCFLTMALQFLVILWLFPKPTEASNSPVSLAEGAA
jgi:uncharacterized protein